MNRHFKSLLMIVLLLGCQAALATPREDATYIVERNLGPEAMDHIRGMLKDQFVEVYFVPLSGRGIEIADRDAFAELIPDEDIAPFLERFLSQSVETYLSIYTPEKLTALAALLHADEGATLEEVITRYDQQRYEAAFARLRTQATPTGADDPNANAMKEVTVRLEAIGVLLDEEPLLHDIPASFGPIFTLLGFRHEIAELERDFDNPVTLAAIQTDGVLRFANPVQRETLLRQLSPPKNTGGIRFIKPPANTGDAD